MTARSFFFSAWRINKRRDKCNGNIYISLYHVLYLYICFFFSKFLISTLLFPLLWNAKTCDAAQSKRKTDSSIKIACVMTGVCDELAWHATPATMKYGRGSRCTNESIFRFYCAGDLAPEHVESFGFRRESSNPIADWNLYDRDSREERNASADSSIPSIFLDRYRSPVNGPLSLSPLSRVTPM